jgi:hypothetical protein
VFSWLGAFAPLRGVMPVIQQHIAQGSMHLERCAQRAQVVTAVEHFTLAREEPVRKLADSSAHTLHSAGDRIIGLRFDQQMHVIALARVVHDTKAMPDAGFA